MLRQVMASGVATLLVLIAGSAPVNAETQITRDARGDVEYWESSTQIGSLRSTRIDILRMRVRYENGSLVVRTRFRDLTRRNTWPSDRIFPSHDYWFDTNRDRRGYEYFMRDATIENLRRSRRGFDPIVSCDGLSWRANLSTDITTLVVPRSCFRREERRLVRIKFTISQKGPDRTPAGDGHYYVDTMEDTVVTDYLRHTRTG